MSVKTIAKSSPRTCIGAPERHAKIFCQWQTLDQFLHYAEARRHPPHGKRTRCREGKVVASVLRRKIAIEKDS